MDYRKETHFIVAYDVEGKLRGKWDILSNQYVGIKGSVLKGKSPAFSFNHITDMNNSFRSAYELVTGYADRWHPFTAEHGKRLEEIISVGLSVRPSWNVWITLLDDKTKLTKECVQFLNEHHGGVYDNDNIEAYRVYATYHSTIEKCVGQETWACGVFSRVLKEIPSEFSKGMVLRGYNEKIFYSYDIRRYAELINTWYNMISAMKDTLEVKHNILSNYVILQWIYNEYKTAHYDENLRNNNDKPWLHFEDDTYVVVPLLSRDDFHTEGELQHNCVERLYMEAVANGQTHVVAIRKKVNPTVPYITCEVGKDGRILQYLLRFNTRPSDEADKNFYSLYQHHLYSSLSQ